MKKLISFLVLLGILYPAAISQDMIVVPDISYRTTDCKIISANQEKVTYKTLEDGIQKSISTDYIARINFGEASDQIVRAFLVYDTIRCEILAVDPDKIVYFSEIDHINKSVPKSQVLFCSFYGGCTLPENEQYIDRFRQMQDYAKNKRVNTIVKKDGSEIKTTGVEIDDKSLYFELYQNDTPIQTYADRNKVRSFIYNEYREKNGRNSLSNYILSSSGRMTECSILNIDTAKLKVETQINERIVQSEVTKDKLCALFFGTSDIDFSKPETLTYQPISGRKDETGNPKVEFDICGLWGYRYSRLSSDIPATLKEYTNKLRDGFGITGNFNLYVNYNTSIGLTYKYMNSHNSTDDINYITNNILITSTSDKINIHFIGLNLQYSSTRRNYFSYDMAVAGGYVIYKDDATLNQIAIEMKGKSYGLSLTNRFNLMTDNNIGFFFDISVFLSSISKYEIEGQTLELDEPDNLSRIELGVGIKFIGE